MKYETLDDLFLLKLKSLYDIETQIIKALPELARAASDRDLKEAFMAHLKETRQQAGRLEEVFARIGKKPQKTMVEAIRGLSEDAKWVIEQDMTDDAKDAALIGAARYVEHYEMAGYMALIEWAKLIGTEEMRDMLDQSLVEEKEADRTLCRLAKRINKRVASAKPA